MKYIPYVSLTSLPMLFYKCVLLLYMYGKKTKRLLLRFINLKVLQSVLLTKCSQIGKQFFFIGGILQFCVMFKCANICETVPLTVELLYYSSSSHETFGHEVLTGGELL